MYHKTLIATLLSTLPLWAAAAPSLQQQIDLATAPVKTAAALQVELNNPSSPLAALGDDLPAFSTSVTFDAQGVTALDSALLQQDLSATEIYHILQLFGWQSTISQYQQATINTDTDRLLLTGSLLPACQAGTTVEVAIERNGNSGVDFSYHQNGVACSGDIGVTSPTTLTYHISHSNIAGLRFTGAGFLNPFNGTIDSVTVSDDGQTLALEDSYQQAGIGKFQFLLTSEENNLVMMSPDPEVINKKI